MKNTKNFKLIKGTFTSSDAKAVLFSLINSKINFHSSESFGIKIRESGDTSVHEKRIAELSKANKSINKLLDQASKKGLKVKVNGTIEVELINESKTASRKV